MQLELDTLVSQVFARAPCEVTVTGRISTEALVWHILLPILSLDRNFVPVQLETLCDGQLWLCNHGPDQQRL